MIYSRVAKINRDQTAFIRYNKSKTLCRYDVAIPMKPAAKLPVSKVNTPGNFTTHKTKGQIEVGIFKVTSYTQNLKMN